MKPLPPSPSVFGTTLVNGKHYYWWYSHRSGVIFTTKTRRASAYQNPPPAVWKAFGLWLADYAQKASKHKAPSVP